MSMLDILFVDDGPQPLENKALEDGGAPGQPMLRAVRLDGGEEARTAVWAHLAGRFDVRAATAMDMRVLGQNLLAAELIGEDVERVLTMREADGPEPAQITHLRALLVAGDTQTRIDWIKEYQAAVSDETVGRALRVLYGEALAVLLKLDVMALLQP